MVLNFVDMDLPWVFPLFMVLLGGVFGSFLTCMLYRVPRGISLSSPPSYCPSCGEKLKAVDLMPVLSYVLFQGKCHYCKAKVSPRYMFIELITIFAFMLTYIIVGAQIALLLALVLTVCLLFITGLLLESRQLAVKVLLFSIIVTAVLIPLLV